MKKIKCDFSKWYMQYLHSTFIRFLFSKHTVIYRWWRLHYLFRQMIYVIISYQNCIRIFLKPYKILVTETYYRNRNWLPLSYSMKMLNKYLPLTFFKIPLHKEKSWIMHSCRNCDNVLPALSFESLTCTLQISTWRVHKILQKGHQSQHWCPTSCTEFLMWW